MEPTEREELLTAVAGATRDAITESTKGLTERIDKIEARVTEPPKQPEPATSEGSLYGAADREIALDKVPARFRSGEGKRVLNDVMNADSDMVRSVGNIIRTVAAAHTEKMSLADATRKFTERIYKDDRAADHLRALNESTDSAGGVFVPIEYSPEFVQLLYAKAVVTKLGARRLPMSRGNLRINRQTTGASVAGNSETGAIPYTEGKYGFIDLTAKDIDGLTSISQDLLYDAGYDVNAFVVADLVMQLKLKLDYNVLYGAGGVDILGLANTAGVGSIAASTATSGRMQADLEAAEEAYWSQNPLNTSPGWLMHPRTHVKLQYAKTTTGAFVFEGKLTDTTFMGRPFATTTQVPIAGNLTDLWLGDWNDLIVGDAQQTRIDTSTEASYVDAAGKTVNAFQAKMVVIRGTLRADAAPEHPQVFQRVANIDLTNWSWT